MEAAKRGISEIQQKPSTTHNRVTLRENYNCSISWTRGGTSCPPHSSQIFCSTTPGGTRGWPGAHDHGRIFAAMERPRGYTPTQAAQLREPHPRANEILGPQTQELIELVLAIDRAAHW